MALKQSARDTILALKKEIAAVLQKVIAKEIKQREDSIEAFKKGNRQDLVDKESAEMAILKSYMPQQMTHDEIVEEARRMILEVGAKGPSDKGKVMGKL